MDTTKTKTMTLLEWQQYKMPKNELIVQASTVDGFDGITLPPIGMSYHYARLWKETCTNPIWIGTHSKTVLCAISPYTDLRRRGYATINRVTIIKTLTTNRIPNAELSPESYYADLSSYKFVISPEGNGIDTHRHYEALIAGCIPIIEESPIIQNKYGNVPILWTRDYSEITEEYLRQKYNEMLDQTWDFSGLFLSHWSPYEQSIIKNRGNYWCHRLAYNAWYE